MRNVARMQSPVLINSQRDPQTTYTERLVIKRWISEGFTRMVMPPIPSLERIRQHDSKISLSTTPSNSDWL